MFQYDPNDVPAIVNDYNSQIGALHVNVKSNAFAFLDDDRNVLDYFITDVNGQFIDGINDEPVIRIVERAELLGAANVLMFHNHEPGSPSGPCDSLIDVFTGIAGALDASGITLRGCIVTIGGVLDGIVIAQKIEDPRLADALRMRDVLTTLAEFGDPAAVTMLPMMEQLIESIANGDEPDERLVNQMLAMVRRAMSDDDQPVAKPNPLSLPAIATNKAYLN